MSCDQFSEVRVAVARETLSEVRRLIGALQPIASLLRPEPVSGVQGGAGDQG